MKRFVATLLLALGASTALAQQYPSRPVRILVTFPPGGSTDLVARILAPHLGERFGRPFLVENRPGASGAIAAEVVTKAPPDGHTLLVAGTSSVLGLNKVLLPNLPYDPKDLVPITLLVTSPFIVATSPDMLPNVHNVRELIAAIKAKGEMTFGSGGPASGMHLAGEYFKSLAGLNMVHVPYKGNGPAIQAVAAGQLPVAFVDLGSTSTLIKSGRIRVLAIAAAKRTALNPELPTAAESGLPGWEALGSFGLVTTIGSPQEVIQRLSVETGAILRMPDVRERILATGNEPAPTTPEEFAAFAKSEVAKWSGVIQQAGIKVEQ